MLKKALTGRVSLWRDEVGPHWIQTRGPRAGPWSRRGRRLASLLGGCDGAEWPGRLCPNAHPGGSCPTFVRGSAQLEGKPGACFLPGADGLTGVTGTGRPPRALAFLVLTVLWVHLPPLHLGNGRKLRTYKNKANFQTYSPFPFLPSSGLDVFSEVETRCLCPWGRQSGAWPCGLWALAGPLPTPAAGLWAARKGRVGNGRTSSSGLTECSGKQAPCCAEASLLDRSQARAKPGGGLQFTTQTQPCAWEFSCDCDEPTFTRDSCLHF